MRFQLLEARSFLVRYGIRAGLQPQPDTIDELAGTHWLARIGRALPLRIVLSTLLIYSIDFELLHHDTFFFHRWLLAL